MRDGLVRFGPAERAALLRVRGVGPQVVARLEQVGIADLRSLAEQEPDDLCARIAAALGSTCWRNSPMARGAIAAAIEAARGQSPIKPAASRRR